MSTATGTRPDDPVLSTPPPPGAFERAFGEILKLPTAAQIVIALLVQIAVVALDVWLPADLHPSFLYVPAVIIVAWAAGPAAGILFSVVSACAEQMLFAPPRESEAIGIANTVLTAMTLVTIVLLVNRLKHHFMGESKLVRHDHLTGLPNARAFHDRLEIEIVRNKRYGQSFAVAYLDCDDFAAVNRQHGRQKGDELLKLVGDTLQRTVRLSDAVARTGGDQFMVLLTGCNNISAQVAARKMQKGLQRAIAETGVPLGVTIGCAVFMTPPASADELMVHADELMARVKRTQKGDLDIEESAAEKPAGG
jgi:diguanylate cyclase (GGDEF)-like protein